MQQVHEVYSKVRGGGKGGLIKGTKRGYCASKEVQERTSKRSGGELEGGLELLWGGVERRFYQIR